MKIIQATERVLYVLDDDGKFKLTLSPAGEKKKIKCECGGFKRLDWCRHADLVSLQYPEMIEKREEKIIPEYIDGKKFTDKITKKLSKINYGKSNHKK